MNSSDEPHPSTIARDVTYDSSLAITSQFYFCGLPLRLDVEPRCQFTCLYCFAKARGGASRPPASSQRVADAEAFRRRLDRVSAGKRDSVVDAMLHAGVPIHFGGMADPFGRVKETQAVTRKLLGALADYRQATVISTKGLTRDNEHYETLQRGRFVVQFSFSTLDSRLARQIEVGLPPPSERLEAMAELSDLGIPVTARLQPLIPGLVNEARDLIDAFAEHGAQHVGVEHLKLPLERGFNGTDQLSRRLGRDLRAEYMSLGAKRVGREYVLPASERLSTILDLRDYVHRRGMQFGAADTDLLLLSDGSCCCSGTDLLGLEAYHRYTYVEAVRRSPPDRITFSSLENVQPPPGTISRFVNSRSRIRGSDESGADIAAYIRRNWNGRPNGPAPGMLWGVEVTGEVDTAGLRVYRLSDEAQNLVVPRV